MRIPLHQEPEDTSPESARKRLRLYAWASSVNPAGFRASSVGGLRNPTARNLRRLEEDKEFRAKVMRDRRPSGFEMKINGLTLLANNTDPEKTISSWLKRLTGG